MLLLRMDEAFSGGGAGSSSDLSSSSPYAYRADSLAAVAAKHHMDDDEDCFSSTVATPRLSVDQDIDCIIDVEGTDDEDERPTSAAPTPSGGRRVYPTPFKLHVLDCYRRDAECRGNQRATARKFGIHRRQIQKWLQGEKLLRASLNNNVEPDEEEEEDFEDEQPIALDLCIKPAVEERLHYLQTEEEEPQPAESPSAPSGGKRRSFTLQFKLDVLDAFYSNAACKGNQRATARLFGINRRQVQKWLCQESQLRGEAALGSADGESSAKRQRLGRWLWNVPQWPPLDPPQDTALCLVKKPEPPPPAPSLIDSPLDSPGGRAKRHSYPLDFKLQALDAYHHDAECSGNQRAVAKRFAIHRRQVQKWLKQEQQLRERVVDKRAEASPPPPPLMAPLVPAPPTLKRPFAFKPLVPVQVLGPSAWHAAVTSVESRPICW
ncbi:coiled-coil and C2 domain-containing protein 1A [Neocloeon triangulifer]|uniref:coiled-coil and C2 domain-containing protein 1A n=1 Tax=Neocloeon triangulifer TaxID=2078957 RepID=UPI00286F6785|nr:coiled-coil and C2 domain-containing protein 1A [Neocloeon triangulifer]